MKIDLTKAAAKDLDRIVARTGLTPQAVLRKSLFFLHAYLKADARGDAWVILPNTSVDNLDDYPRVVTPKWIPNRLKGGKKLCHLNNKLV